jgi:hypothetical protein
MEALLIAEENESKLLIALDAETADLELSVFKRSEKKFYLIRDYVNVVGHNVGTRVLPEFVLKDCFVFDPDGASSDWDTIYRKAPEAETLPYKE